MIQLDIVSSEEQLFSGKVTFLVVPGELGDIGVYPNHAPLLLRLRQGIARYAKEDGECEEFVYISGGIFELYHNKACVLADVAIRGHKFDQERMSSVLEQAKILLLKRHHDKYDAHVKIELAQALAELAALRKMKIKSGAGH
jgi:F-type H+-transporting ATPase subunit epsilon